MHIDTASVSVCVYSVGHLLYRDVDVPRRIGEASVVLDDVNMFTELQNGNLASNELSLLLLGRH